MQTTSIQDLLVIEPTVYGDDRGYFFESFRQDVFEKEVGKIDFIQDNQSFSKAGILRGLHFQSPPYEQGKLVRVIQGSVLDVAEDIRVGSPTYGKHFSIELSGENKRMFWVPGGFAHGFLTLENDTIFSYKCTNYYNKESEGCIKWDSESLNINWGIENPVLSSKDLHAGDFKVFSSPF